MSGLERTSESCPLCRGFTFITDGKIHVHEVSVDGWGVACLATGMFRGEAETLAERLRKAAHP